MGRLDGSAAGALKLEEPLVDARWVVWNPDGAPAFGAEAGVSVVQAVAIEATISATVAEKYS